MVLAAHFNFTSFSTRPFCSWPLLFLHLGCFCLDKSLSGQTLLMPLHAYFCQECEGTPRGLYMVQEVHTTHAFLYKRVCSCFLYDAKLQLVITPVEGTISPNHTCQCSLATNTKLQYKPKSFFHCTLNCYPTYN